MSDIDMWRAAANLITEHGDAAQDQALKRADAAIDDGDINGFNWWKRVARLFADMQSRTPGDDVH
jgi:hypothetical protein